MTSVRFPAPNQKYHCLNLHVQDRLIKKRGAHRAPRLNSRRKRHLGMPNRTRISQRAAQHRMDLDPVRFMDVSSNFSFPYRVNMFISRSL